MRERQKEKLHEAIGNEIAQQPRAHSSVISSLIHFNLAINNLEEKIKRLYVIFLIDRRRSIAVKKCIMKERIMVKAHFV